MSVFAGLAIGFAGSALSFVLAVVIWGEWGYRNLTARAANLLLVPFLLLNVTGWIVAVVSVG